MASRLRHLNLQSIPAIKYQITASPLATTKMARCQTDKRCFLAFTNPAQKTGLAVNHLIFDHIFPKNGDFGQFFPIFMRFNYISKSSSKTMSGIGIVIVLGAIIASMGLALFMYTQYETNFIESTAGNPVVVGPVEYVITFEGTHEGDEDQQPENTYVMVGITAENISDEKTVISGGQFYIVDGKEKKHKAVFGEFSAKDLYLEGLEPDKPIQRTTQFDIPFDEETQYKIIIRPQKDQSTVDTAVVCLTNC